MTYKIDINDVSITEDSDYEALGWGKNETALNYIGFIPYLIKSNQEQQELIVDLQSRVAALENPST